MTTYVEARAEVITKIAADITEEYPDLVIEYDNSTFVDRDSVGHMYLRVDIDFDNAYFLTINDMPIHEVQASAYFTVFIKEGSGTLEAVKLLDYVTSKFKFHKGTHCQFFQPTLGRKQTRDGWWSQVIEAPFTFNSLT